MTSPAPSEGEDPRDQQSETVSPPERDDAPPVRTRRTGALVAAPLVLWIGLGVAILVVALVVLL
jgi:hypothetical protein